ncbi:MULTISPECIES: hypothetical protein [unclassified Streptomyces]|uniref:hypothetical protein n=1 Tax=unclassified Streptomyces TaxID=2593676 RepID=UPI000F45CBDA|nr:hypothetical protein [Streptomyces sp. I6]
MSRRRTAPPAWRPGSVTSSPAIDPQDQAARLYRQFPGFQAGIGRRPYGAPRPPLTAAARGP